MTIENDVKLEEITFTLNEKLAIGILVESHIKRVTANNLFDPKISDYHKYLAQVHDKLKEFTK